MEISKFHYSVLEEPQKIYFDCETVALREKLNKAFASSVAVDESTGIFGKYLKHDGLYRVKYIHSRNKQLQPQTVDRYFYLLDVSEDSKGAYIEYALVHDKLFDPLIRLVYVAVSLAVLAYIAYLYRSGALSPFSCAAIAAVVIATVGIVFKKSKETADMAKKAEKIFKNLFDGWSN